MVNKLIQDKLMRYINTHFGYTLPVQIGLLFIQAFTITFILLYLFIKYYKNHFANSARPFTPESHKKKSTTPTMGGLCILIGGIIPLIFSKNMQNPTIFLGIISLLSFGFIGLCDDLCKLFYKKGISAFSKFTMQFFFAGTIACTMVYVYSFTHTIIIPFIPNITFALNQYMTIGWIIFLFIACANAVNLTDGLDGLAVECLIPNFLACLLLITLTSNIVFAEYAGLVLQDISQLAFAIAALLGALYAFLWFNTYPALIFMGDVGSLALGSFLAYSFLQTHYEFFLIIPGIFFIIETMSVIMQVLSFKIFKKRVLNMAPYHHHLELNNIHEARIVKIFSMITWGMLACLVIGLLGNCFYTK